MEAFFFPASGKLVFCVAAFSLDLQIVAGNIRILHEFSDSFYTRKGQDAYRSDTRKHRLIGMGEVTLCLISKRVFLVSEPLL